MTGQMDCVFNFFWASPVQLSSLSREIKRFNTLGYFVQFNSPVDWWCHGLFWISPALARKKRLGACGGRATRMAGQLTARAMQDRTGAENGSRRCARTALRFLKFYCKTGPNSGTSRRLQFRFSLGPKGGPAVALMWLECRRQFWSQQSRWLRHAQPPLGLCSFA